MDLLLFPMDQMSKPLLIERLNDTLVITFNRPEIRSPLSVAVLEKLRLLVKELNGDPTVKRVVFAGRDGVFASGADLREIADVTAATAREFASRGQNLMDGIASLEQTTVAAIDGFCFGGALDLALACERRIASTGSTFSHPGASLGIITGWGGTQRLPRLIGQAAALEMFLTARRVDSADALAMGLIDEIIIDPLTAGIKYCGKASINSSLPRTSLRRRDE